MPQHKANKYMVKNCKHFAQEGTGSLFYLTSIVCHFRSLLRCALRRSVEWANNDKEADKKWQPNVVR
jgi:hypothetical protein